MQLRRKISIIMYYDGHYAVVNSFSIWNSCALISHFSGNRFKHDFHESKSKFYVSLLVWNRLGGSKICRIRFESKFDLQFHSIWVNFLIITKNASKRFINRLWMWNSFWINFPNSLKILLNEKNKKKFKH